jgi:hypothetical protein
VYIPGQQRPFIDRNNIIHTLGFTTENNYFPSCNCTPQNIKLSTVRVAENVISSHSKLDTLLCFNFAHSGNKASRYEKGSFWWEIHLFLFL